MSRLFMRFPGFKPKALTLSYDDGVRQDKRLIAIMQKYGLKGTFNLNGGLFAESFNGETKGKMTKEDRCLPASLKYDIIIIKQT